MAPTTAHTAGFAPQQQTRRPLSRIVPAIPHRLSRAPVPAARPITPEQPNQSAVPQPQPQPAPTTLREEQPEEQPESQPVAAVDGPLTPESTTSGADKSETDGEGLAHSPPTSHDDHGDNKDAEAPAPDTSVNGHKDHTENDASATTINPKTTLNGVRRRLTIPAQLPPPFYPSNTTDSPTPPAQGTDESRAPVHRHQFSAGALEFHITNTSPAVPTTPQDTEQDPHQVKHTFTSPPPPPPPSGLAPPQYAQYIPTHSQHPSDAGLPWIHAPYSAMLPEHVFENGNGYRTSPFHTGPMAQTEQYAGQFPSADPTVTTNGMDTSHPQSPKKTQFGEPQPGSEYGEEHRPVQYHNGTSHATDHLNDPLVQLACYLSSQFANPEFADFILQIRSPESALVSIPVHGVVVARSPVIAEAVLRSPAPTHRSRDARRLLDVMTLDPFATRESLEEAVKVLYGAPLLTAQSFLYRLAPFAYDNSPTPPSNEARGCMQQVLSYVAAAKSLQMSTMQARGVDIANMLLRWDTVDQVLRYGLGATPARSEAAESEDYHIARLLSHAIDFMAYHFPAAFKLYTIAPEFQDVPRLPVLLDARPPTHNPRLSKIRFGDAPPEDDLSSNYIDRVLSTILFSLPPLYLERLFNHRATANQVGWTGAVKLMRDVLVERENRRQKALRGQLKPAQDGRVPAALMETMYTEEQLDSSSMHPSGYRLTTKRSSAET